VGPLVGAVSRTSFRDDVGVVVVVDATVDDVEVLGARASLAGA
jgi:hypothetical protein